MKKAIVLFLTLVMIFTMTAFGEESKQEAAIIRLGSLADVNGNDSAAYLSEHLFLEHDLSAFNDTPAAGTKFEAVQYNTLSAMLLDLQAGNLTAFVINHASAEYIAARDENIVLTLVPMQHTSYSMVTLEDNEELYNLLNDTIIAIKADGTMDQLIEQHLMAYVENDPSPVQLPVIEGAPTYRIAITGDMPPMDFITADGKAAGFNVALLSEISLRANVNIEVAAVESGARAAALASGRVDAYFWTASNHCAEHTEIASCEPLTGSVATENYVTLESRIVFKK